MRSPDPARAGARLGTPHRSRGARRQVRIRPQFALFLSCINEHERKGWLFADTVGGANASANLHSLIETAKANGIEPYRYLVVLFKKLPLAQTADDYEALLPWNIGLPAA